MRIGLFDSGIGGLAVLTACKKYLPDAQYIYIDDSEHAPYGSKLPGEVVKIADNCVKQLISLKCDAIVIACNTATAASAKVLRERYNLPIIGIEPAVKPALSAVSGKVLLLSTPLTAMLRKYDSRVIVGIENTLAVDIEKAYGDPSAMRELVSSVLSRYTDYDCVVTGCTHYSHLIPYINVPVFDGADGVARELYKIVREKIMSE